MCESDLQKYNAVNNTETLEELAEIILAFADDDGMIAGLTTTFSVTRMAAACKIFENDMHNILTRHWGIRQQAFMLAYYKKERIE